MANVEEHQQRCREIGELPTIDITEAEKTAWTTIGLPAISPRAVSWSVSTRRLVTVGDSGEPVAGDYELQEVIGEGGMGVVYAARQTALGRLVALKRMRRQDCAVEDRSRFLAEAAVSGRLDHPNIVPIHDVGVDEQGVPFYTMKRVSGRPWSQALRTLSEDENLDILLRVADAAAFAHDHGVIHRDLKPENVMLGAYGEVLLVDWGLACDIAELQSQLRLGVAGTPAYMAPEMAWGEAKLIGPRSDIYLLGAILYEILIGEPPHQGRTVRDAIQAAGANRIDPAVPGGELGAIAARALAMQPEDRFHSVQEFQMAVRAYRTHAASGRLVHSGQEFLQRARIESGYASYSRAMHAFEESLVLWPEHAAALAGVQQARSECATRAIDCGDLDLAESLLAEGVPEDHLLTQRLGREQQLRQRTHRRVRMLSWLSGGLGCLVLVVLGLSLWVMSRQYHQVVRATHERVDAEARLLREESQRIKRDRLSWMVDLSEDFSTSSVASPLSLEPDHWEISDAALITRKDGATLHFPEPASGNVRVQVDLVNNYPVGVYLGVVASDLLQATLIAPIHVEIGSECQVAVDGRVVATVDVPAAAPGLFQRLLVEKEGTRLRVLLDGRELVRLEVPGVPRTSEANIVVRAGRGAGIDNLRIYRLQ